MQTSPAEAPRSRCCRGEDEDDELQIPADQQLRALVEAVGRVVSPWHAAAPPPLEAADRAPHSRSASLGYIACR